MYYVKHIRTPVHLIVIKHVSLRAGSVFFKFTRWRVSFSVDGLFQVGVKLQEINLFNDNSNILLLISG